MVTKWKKGLSLLALFLGVTFFVVGAAGTAMMGVLQLQYSGGAYRPQDAFASDYRDTALFRQQMESYLKEFINFSVYDPSGQQWPTSYQQDPNLLYWVVIALPTSGREVVVSNTAEDLSTAQLPSGFQFLLRFVDGKASIQKDGKVVDVYGNGYYSSKSLWHLPGYINYPATEEQSRVCVYLAAIDQPVDAGGYHPLLQVFQMLGFLRWVYIALLASLIPGVLLLALAFHWREARQAARLALARRLAVVPLEGKLLVLFGYPVVFLWLYTQFPRFPLGIYSFFLMAPLFCLSYPWLFYLAGCDLRHNPKPWRNSLCGKIVPKGVGALNRAKAALSQAELALPFQRRFLSRGVAAGVALLLLVLQAPLLLFIWFSAFRGAPLPAILGAAVIALAVLVIGRLALQGWTLVRQLSPFINQLSAVRSGELVQPLKLPEGSDLHQAAEDLNGIQQGMRSALDERMRSEQMKVELIANVSHDLKTPLTSVISYAELLREEEGLPEHVQDYIRILSEKAQRLAVMVQDVFEVSRAASGDLTLHSERLDLGKLLRQTLADMDEVISQSPLTLRIDLPADPVWVIADGDRLYRVFQNLIQNALQYSLEGSRVYLSLLLSGNAAVASIQNTSRSELPAGVDFTERFTRGDQSRTDGGSGLGLAIASSFTAACGGSFQVRTEADLFTAEAKFSTVS